MNLLDGISMKENVTLVSLKNVPNSAIFLKHVFGAVSKENVIVDMVSFAFSQSSANQLSFTIDDSQLPAVFTAIAALKPLYPQMQPVVSSGNAKISLNGQHMKNSVGDCYDIFSICAGMNVDILLITTSETSISLLTPCVHHRQLLDALSLLM